MQKGLIPVATWRCKYEVSMTYADSGKLLPVMGARAALLLRNKGLPAAVHFQVIFKFHLQPPLSQSITAQQNQSYYQYDEKCQAGAETHNQLTRPGRRTGLLLGDGILFTFAIIIPT